MSSAGSGDPAYKPVGRVPSRGVTSDAVYSHEDTFHGPLTPSHSHPACLPKPRRRQVGEGAPHCGTGEGLTCISHHFFHREAGVLERSQHAG